MKKLVLFAAAVMFFTWSAMAQSIPYSEDFESYTVGDFISIETPTWWTTWSNAPGTGEDAHVSDNFANSPTKSLFIDPNDGLTDLILKLGDKTSGVYNVDWYMYVEGGYQAYYDFQHFQVPGIEWAFEIWFYANGTGELLVGGTYYPFTYPSSTWFMVEHYINLDIDLATFTIDGMAVHSWPFSYVPGGIIGINQLGGVDFYNIDPTYRYYIDDISFDFNVGTPEESKDVEIVICPNPVTDHLHITSGVEIKQVEIFNQPGQKVCSQLVKGINFNLNTLGFNAGVYFVRITTKEGISTRKIIIK